VALDKITKKSRDAGQLPLEYSSDEDFVYQPEISQGFEDDNLFIERVDENGKILKIHDMLDNNDH